MSTPRLTIVLVLIVLGHLGCMASPLHTPAGPPAEALGPEPGATHSEGPDEASPWNAVAGPLGDPDHCALTWSLPREPGMDLNRERLRPCPLPVEFGVSASACRLAHAVGPAPSADLHALLHMFRE